MTSNLKQNNHQFSTVGSRPHPHNQHQHKTEREDSKMQEDDDEAAEKRQRKERRLRSAIEQIAPEEHHYDCGEGSNKSLAKHPTSSSSLSSGGIQQYHVVITKTQGRVERRRASSLRLISDYLVATDKKENARRQMNQRRSKERNQTRQRSDKSCRALEEVIAPAWEACSTQKSAWDTKEAIEKQQDRCTALIRAKDDLIQDHSFFRRLADDDHAASLKDHTGTFDALKHSIESELLEMQQLFEEELDTIEEAFADDRAKLLESNQDEIANLILEKSHLQLHHIQTNQSRREGNLGDIQEKRTRSREEHAKLKASLEDQVCELEQKLEKAKSSHQMNANKLDCVVRILSERNEEAAAIIKKQKKRLVQSKANFNESRDQNLEDEKRGDKQVAALIRDCKAFDARNKGLWTKSRRFELHDEGWYQALLDMHIDELSQLADKTKRFESEIACRLRGKGGGSLMEMPRHQTGPRVSKEEEILDKLSSTIDESAYRGWVELESQLEAYKDVLDDRRRNDGTTARIVNDSHKLRRRMKTIATSEESTELLCPPTMFLQATKVAL